jgi:hypothetical protein
MDQTDQHSAPHQILSSSSPDIAKRRSDSEGDALMSPLTKTFIGHEEQCEGEDLRKSILIMDPQQHLNSRQTHHIHTIKDEDDNTKEDAVNEKGTLNFLHFTICTI